VDFYKLRIARILSVSPMSAGRSVAATQLAIFAALLLAAGWSASAQVITVESDSDQEQPTTFKMTVSPAREPRPALKHHFLTPPVDRIKGNAALYYYKALSFESPNVFSQLRKEDSHEYWDELRTMPLDKFPTAEIAKKIGWFEDHQTIDMLRDAARCEYCNWEDDIRRHGISTLLPQTQESRTIAHALALQARLQIAQGKYDAAIESLHLGYALSRDLGRGTALVQFLVGIAGQGIIDEQTRTLIAAANSPNLYWALTELAAQPVELRQSLSYESRFWQFTIHKLDDLDRRIFTPEEAAEVASQLERVMPLTSLGRRGNDEPYRFLSRFPIVAGAILLHPQAKAYLIDHGYTAAKVDAMPVIQAVLLYWWKQFEIVRDDAFKLLLLPDGEVYANVARYDRAVKAAAIRRDGGVFTVLLPAVSASFHARIRARRQTELLRAVEALRMHAAEHGGWPEKLEDVTVVPVPRDPLTDRPFVYAVNEGVAILEMSPTPPPVGGLRVNQRYELTLRNTPDRPLQKTDAARKQSPLDSQTVEPEKL
jgi:hypothetical protein